jgi:hypothetical protein
MKVAVLSSMCHPDVLLHTKHRKIMKLNTKSFAFAAIKQHFFTPVKEPQSRGRLQLSGFKPGSKSVAVFSANIKSSTNQILLSKS